MIKDELMSIASALHDKLVPKFGMAETTMGEALRTVYWLLTDTTNTGGQEVRDFIAHCRVSFLIYWLHQNIGDGTEMAAAIMLRTDIRTMIEDGTVGAVSEKFSTWDHNVEIVFKAVVNKVEREHSKNYEVAMIRGDDVHTYTVSAIDEFHAGRVGKKLSPDSDPETGFKVLDVKELD